MITTKAQRAIAAAAVYAESGMVAYLSPAARSCAEEDFQAGYLAGLRAAEESVAFMHRQLGQIKELAAQNDELYSLAIAQYTMEKVR